MRINHLKNSDFRITHKETKAVPPLLPPLAMLVACLVSQPLHLRLQVVDSCLLAPSNILHLGDRIRPQFLLEQVLMLVSQYLLMAGFLALYIPLRTLEDLEVPA